MGHGKHGKHGNTEKIASLLNIQKKIDNFSHFLTNNETNK